MFSQNECFMKNALPVSSITGFE